MQRAQLQQSCVTRWCCSPVACVTRIILQHSKLLAVLGLAHCVCQPMCVRTFLPVAAVAAQLHPVLRYAFVTLTRHACCQPLRTPRQLPYTVLLCVAVATLLCLSSNMGLEPWGW